MKSLIVFVCALVSARCTSIPSSAKPVQLLRLGSGETAEVIFNPEIVESLFLDPILADRQVVIFSIIGDFRKGKSFIMNYALRYMYAHYKSVSNDVLINADDWLGDANEPLTGFAWGSGVDRVTTGLIMWSDVFLYEDRGEKFAIYIMDTQGLFDHKTTSAENAKIFSLSTMISSMQILNLINIIQENQLEYLHFATSYADYASATQDKAAFQNLMFLIRDWNSLVDHRFGLNGGKDYLEVTLKTHGYQSQTLKEVREFIRSSFDKVECFLMPHPGKKVAQDSTYNGSWRDIDEEFIAAMMDFFKFMFSPSKLTPKKINGRAIKPADLLVFIKTYVDNFKDHLPSTTNVYSATMDKQFEILMGKTVDIYTEAVGYAQIEPKSEDDIKIIHDSAYDKALKYFNSERQFGTNTDGIRYKNKLIAKLEDAYRKWKTVTMDQISKLVVLEKKTEDQNLEVQKAQTLDNQAKEKLVEVEKKTDDAKDALEKARTDTAEAQAESRKLAEELAAAQLERADAIKKEQETRDYLDKMKNDKNFYESQYNELKQTASNNVGESLGEVQQQSGIRSVIGDIAILVTALTPIVGMIFRPNDKPPAAPVTFGPES